jgi:hypothetical protein
MTGTDSYDVAIVGAGAAGLATAIFTARARPALRIALLDGAKKPGAKILVSGGGRCNVTNARVTDADFWGGKRTIVRQVLRAYRVERTIELFASLGVALHEEADGKLFPDSNRARDVLAALLGAAAACGIEVRGATRVHGVTKQTARFALATDSHEIRADAVVLATGGQSLPKTGSDGAGYDFARALGHTIVPLTPALAPLVLDAAAPEGIHRDLSGVAADVELAVWVDGAIAARLGGALLWTHFGASGPVVLNASRHWARAVLEGRVVRLSVSFYPGASFERADSRWTNASRERPRSTLKSALASDLPDALATAVLRALQIPPDRPLAALTREDRRRLVHGLTDWPLPVVDTRGYNFAEATAGGVSLDEIDPRTMESRACPGLYLVGEMLDVDGRIGGFNFQWAWSSAFVAGRALSARGRA